MRKKYNLAILTAIISLSMTCFLSACGTNGAANTTTTSVNAQSEITASVNSASSVISNGILGNFESVDINNNTVTQAIFADKKLTMVNIWATFCGPCISEMPELGELNKEYADKGFQIVGIPVDTADQKGNPMSDMVDTAKEIIAKTGADYAHIMPSVSLIQAKLNQVSSVPETIFVDATGTQVGKSYIGSRSKAEWTRIVDELLNQIQ